MNFKNVFPIDTIKIIFTVVVQLACVRVAHTYIVLYTQPAKHDKLIILAYDTTTNTHRHEQLHAHEACVPISCARRATARVKYMVTHQPDKTPACALLEWLPVSLPHPRMIDCDYIQLSNSTLKSFCMTLFVGWGHARVFQLNQIYTAVACIRI